MNAAIARIILRYLAGFLVAKGLISSEFAADADVAFALEFMVGVAIAAFVELWYAMARRKGWL